MSDYSELKCLAEALIEHDADSFYLPCTIAFERAATPSVVLALLAENESLRKALIMIRDEAYELRICEIAADALIDANRSPENP